MRDILLAVALTWCLWLTWDIHHNYKQDKRSNIIDQATLKILKIHCNRLDKIESENESRDEWIDSINQLLHKHIDEKEKSYGDFGEDSKKNIEKGPDKS